jgi:hypothetical protein
VVLTESLENLFQNLKLPLVGVRVGVIDVDDDVLQVAKDPIHEMLESGWTAKESHGRINAVKLSYARNRECGE